MTTISDYFGMRPPKVFKYSKEDTSCTNPDLILGVELETEGCTLGARDYERMLTGLGYTVKEDGSLRTVDGLPAYEFISQPTATKHLLPALGDYFKATKFGERNFSDRTSVHVHANCTDLTFEQVASICLLYTVVEPILFEFVNDKPGHKDNWSRDTNIYCIPWNQCRNHFKLVQEFLEAPNDAVGRWQKYTALNVAPLARFGTVEFRHMHGTADMTKLTAWINMIGAMFLYGTKTKLEDLSKEIIQLNTVSHYEAFFNQVLGRQLPYNETYRALLEEGTIMAKYSMSTWANKKAGIAKRPLEELLAGAPDEIHHDDDGDEEGDLDWAAPRAAPQQVQIAPAIRPWGNPEPVIRAGNWADAMRGAPVLRQPAGTNAQRARRNPRPDPLAAARLQVEQDRIRREILEGAARNAAVQRTVPGAQRVEAPPVGGFMTAADLDRWLNGDEPQF